MAGSSDKEGIPMSRLTEIIEEALSSSSKVPKKESPSSNAAEIPEEVVRAIEIRRKMIDLKFFQSQSPSEK